MPEVQKHGFTWEKDLIQHVYGATLEELAAIKYTNKMDLPASLNRLGSVDLSIKTSCSPEAVCMADCLRIYDAVSSGKPMHMVVLHYKQNDETNTKKIICITEVNLTASAKELFGTLTRAQIEELDRCVKSVPQKRKPTVEEHDRMYALRNSLQALSGAIHLDIKCNSEQSRLQCSFNRFRAFVAAHPERVVATSNTNLFRGGSIQSEVASARRQFKKKEQSAAPHSEPHLPPI